MYTHRHDYVRHLSMHQILMCINIYEYMTPATDSDTLRFAQQKNGAWLTWIKPTHGQM